MKWTPNQIRELRQRYEESQEEFCKRLGVGAGAIRHWEQNRGEPSGPVQILLTRLEEDLKQVAG